MFFFKMHGRRTARIKKYTETQEHCRNCKSFDLDIKVYRDYYHYILIPIVPIGDKTAKIYCNHCGEGLRTETITKHYEKATRTPFYLYSGMILLGLTIVFIIIVNIYEQKQKAVYVDNPKVGDVYGMREDRNNLAIYYFLRISEIKGDSVYLLSNNLEYYGYPAKFDDADFFRNDDQLVFTKKDLKLMLDTGSINSVQRGYSDWEGFQRIQ